jgi:hypothetical protein
LWLKRQLIVVAEAPVDVDDGDGQETGEDQRRADRGLEDEAIERTGTTALPPAPRTSFLAAGLTAGCLLAAHALPSGRPL